MPFLRRRTMLPLDAVRAALADAAERYCATVEFPQAFDIGSPWEQNRHHKAAERAARAFTPRNAGQLAELLERNPDLDGAVTRVYHAERLLEALALEIYKAAFAEHNILAAPDKLIRKLEFRRRSEEEAQWYRDEVARHGEIDALAKRLAGTDAADAEKQRPDVREPLP